VERLHPAGLLDAEVRSVTPSASISRARSLDELVGVRGFRANVVLAIDL
jgi:hypothetical protein